MHKRFWREVEAFLFGGFLGEVRGAFPEKKAPSLILSECFEESDLANGLHRGQRVGEGHEDVPRHQTPAVRRRLGLRAVGKREPRSRIRGDGLLRRQFLRFARGEGAAFAGILRRSGRTRPPSATWDICMRPERV